MAITKTISTPVPSRGWLRTPAGVLFRRIFALNAIVFALGTLVLALSPATISAPLMWAEVPVLVCGVLVMLGANAFVLRTSLAPLDALAQLMRRLDRLWTTERLDEEHSGDLSELVATFNAMLDRLQAERAVTNASALAAQESERRRIARELHDEIGQTLTVALLVLKRSADRAPVKLRNELHSAQESIRDSLNEVRVIARRLRPDVLEDLGLQSALAALCNEFSEASNIHVTRTVDPLLPRLSAEAELVCYRVAQEALTNVARHADATDVSMAVANTLGGLDLSIADNGCGGAKEGGAGIQGMRERALLVGARLSLSSPTGCGTTVRLVIPNNPESN
jgi:two-component system sensor histidine kinase UhpB